MQEGDKFYETYCVTEKVYSGFIDLFKDDNPLHLNAEFAQSKNFKDKVMHGAILSGFLSHFIGVCLPIKNVLVQTYELHFLKPLYLNEILNFEATIVGIFESVNTIEFKYKFLASKNTTVAKGKILISII